jgi:hypothetical protein
MPKNDSDVFICKLKRDGYWAYPSPFVAHGGGTEIQFRNLTGDAIEIDFGSAPVHGKHLSLAPNAKGAVIVDGDAPPGLHEYVAEVTPAKAVTSVGRVRAGRAGGASATKKAAKARKVGRILVKGGSPPRIIIDT